MVCEVVGYSSGEYVVGDGNWDNGSVLGFEGV